MSTLPATRSRPSRSSTSRAPHRWQFVAGVVLGIAAVGPAWALTLDAIAEQSLLGQLFRIVVPVVAQPGEELSGECFKVVPARVDTTDGVPEVTTARVALEQSAGASRLVVTTGRAVNEPVMRVTLQAGCDRAIRREYLLLFDPPLTEAPAVDTRMPSVSASGTPAASSEAASLPDAVPVTGETAAAPADTRSNSADAGRTPGTPAPERKPAAAGQGAGPRVTATSTSTPARAERPRLAISRTVAGTGTSGKGTAENFSALTKSAQEAALEEQEVVLRSRIAELSAQVERMQQERIAELAAAVERLQVEVRAAEAAQRAAEEAAKSAPWAVLVRWWEEAWPWVASLAAIVALAAGGVAWRRRRPRSRVVPGGETPLMAHLSDGMHVDTYLDEALIPGPKTVPRKVMPQGTFVQGGHADTLPQFPNEHEDAFDHEMATRPARPGAKARRG